MRQLKDLFQLTDRFYVPTEDILLIDINISGVNMDVDTDRVRMYVRLLFGQDFPFFLCNSYSEKHEISYQKWLSLLRQTGNGTCRKY